MKTLLPLILFLCSELALSQPFITTWKTDNPGISANNQIIIPTTGTGYAYSIYWEQVGNTAINGTIAGPITGNQTINFPNAGIYRVSIDGAFPQIYFPYDSANNNNELILKSDHRKLLTVEQWGSNVWRSMESAFQGCVNLTIPATDAPNLTQVTDMSSMFVDAFSFNQPIDHWDVSNVTNMRGMFFSAANFNQPLETWNVSHVLNMNSMFFNATRFNQPLKNWDVRQVMYMSTMFWYASDFDQTLGDWNVGNVVSMGDMLSHTALSMNNYDQTLIGWASQDLQSRVFLGAEGLRYCIGDSARMKLITKNGWTITGDSKDNQFRLPAPVALSTQPICYGSTGSISITIQNPNDLYSFDNGVTFQSSNIFTGLGAGTYPVMLNRTGCISSATPVTINPSFDRSPTPVLSGTPVVCPNIVAVDYSASNTAYTYQWFIEGGAIASEQNNYIKVNWGASNFNASVKAIGIDQNNCPTDTAVFPVKIQIQLKPTLPVGFDSVCYNFRAGVPYQTTNTNGSTYTWFTNGGLISQGQGTSQSKINWANVGDYKLWVKEENTTTTDYCEGISDTLTVTVFKDLAAITLNFVSVDYTDDKNVQLQWEVSLLERVSDLVIVSRRIAGSNNPWQQVATLVKNVQSFLDQNLSTSTNIYEYKIEGFNKCDEGLQTVIHNTIKLAGDKVEAEELINLNWNDYNGWTEVERYEVWRKLDTDTEYKLIDVTPGDLTLYSGKYGGDGFVHHLRIKAKKEGSNTISWSNEIELDFENPIDLIPNVITPNDDGENDLFIIPKLHLYSDNALIIYDRWGKVVFSKINYDNTWNAEGLSGGVYFYSLIIHDTPKNLKGWLQVIR